MQPTISARSPSVRLGTHNMQWPPHIVCTYLVRAHTSPIFCLPQHWFHAHRLMVRCGAGRAKCAKYMNHPTINTSRSGLSSIFRKFGTLWSSSVESIRKTSCNRSLAWAKSHDALPISLKFMLDVYCNACLISGVSRSEKGSMMHI